ncbi:MULTISPECIES: hypothetical protein [Cobetia]|uniref:hypothetical protein n=2 Tax=Halomonadaceae TaxID=28256 RepID=UPI0012F4D7FB|nr:MULTISPECIES: hypothetical protein [Cobetia]
MSNDREVVSRKYHVDDLPGTKLPATRITGILERLQQGEPISQLSLRYLDSQGLLALKKFIMQDIPFDQFHQEAEEEQILRIRKAKLDRIAKEEEARLIEEARQESVRIAQQKSLEKRKALEKTPQYKARMKNRFLRNKYAIDCYIEKIDFHRLMDILRRIDEDNRLFENDLLWLSTHGRDYFSKELRSAYHHAEARFYEEHFNRSQDVWMAINASSHYRKCGKSLRAAEILKAIDIVNMASRKMKTAFHTTFGGVQRDLGHRDEAIDLAMIAHGLMSKDFRPCTLLGAIYMEGGQVSLGHEWYEKAIERGASEEAIDSELRIIFNRANHKDRQDIRKYLLQVDSRRFSWVKNR